MKQPIKIPAVGESITEVTIASWLKKNGDLVRQDEIIAEIDSEKASFELAAPHAGVITLKKAKGDTAVIDEIVAEIDTEAKASASPSPNSASVPASSARASATGVHEMRVPAVGESITEVTIGSWLKKDGDFVKADEIIAEIESEKATFELPSEATGILRIIAQLGVTIPIGALICKIEKTGDSVSTTPSSVQVATGNPVAASSYAQGHASPAASKILAEKGIDTASVAGSGRDGRITKADANVAQAKPATTPSASSAPVVATSGARVEKREKMTSLRKTIAKRLVSVKNETAMLSTFNEVDMKPVMDLRARYKDKFKERYNIGLGFMSFFVKAVCQALQQFPAVNASIDKDEIVYHNYCDVSIAVSTSRGLVVPVIRNAESLSMAQIESEIANLAARGRDGKLSIEEMTGGTFSITNGGVFGSMLSTPIINPPQAAILGMHNIVERPLVKNGEIVIRPIMYLALSYDHRIIDGRESVSFLVRVKELLEDPGRLLLSI